MAEFRCKRDDLTGGYELFRDGASFAILVLDHEGRPGWFFHDFGCERTGRATRARIKRLGRGASLRDVLAVVRAVYADCDIAERSRRQSRSALSPRQWAAIEEAYANA